jgi:glyoxylase-like metal-dependent hydrolase (beta-lactamase superfamily II)
MTHARPSIEGFFDPQTWTVSYVVSDPHTKRAAIIDPVLDYDFKSGHTDTQSADAVLAHVSQQGLTVEWILETHAHADHLSGARYLQGLVGGRIAIGENIREVQATFKKLYNLERTFLPDGSQFDHLFKDGESFRIGEIEATALLVPGHTPADMAYLMGDAVFVGDTLFMPDVGSARADFPGGDAHTLYRSMRRLLGLPPQTRLFVCHDYPPPGRGPQWETTVAAQRAGNIHVRDGIDEDTFVAMRKARDATLDVPTLILPSIQVNVRAGQLPPADDNGVAYLRIPLNALPTRKPA